MPIDVVFLVTGRKKAGIVEKYFNRKSICSETFLLHLIVPVMEN